MATKKSSLFADMFDRVAVINLSRRPDRMSTLRRQLEMLGMSHTRFEAIDGRVPDVANAWQGYSAKAVQTLPEGDAPVRDWRDFYLGDKTRASRVAYFEGQSGRKAIASAGAWGLFYSMKGVLEQAVKDSVKSILVFEDDVLFHRDTVELWRKMRGELPDDWKILQLGAMQLHWEDNWIKWHSDHLYRCNGSSLAAHAFALRGDMIAEVLAACDEPALPFDIGALQEVKRRHREHCFTCYPNLAIQDTKDTEIGMSKIFFRESKKEDNIYRWKWKDYGPAQLKAYDASAAPSVSAADKPSAAPKKQTPKKTANKGADRRRMHPYGLACPDAPRVIALISETADAPADPYLDLLARQRDNAVAAPIIVIEDLALVPRLRERRLAFEFVPPVHLYAHRLSGIMAAEIAVLRRLALLRRKWSPVQILSFGETSALRLEAWRNSAFEVHEPGPDLFPTGGAQDTPKSA